MITFEWESGAARYHMIEALKANHIKYENGIYNTLLADLNHDGKLVRADYSQVENDIFQIVPYEEIHLIVSDRPLSDSELEGNKVPLKYWATKYTNRSELNKHRNKDVQMVANRLGLKNNSEVYTYELNRIQSII